MSKLSSYGGKKNSNDILINIGTCSGLAASCSWIFNKPPGWTGRDYVKANQLKTTNFPYFYFL